MLRKTFLYQTKQTKKFFNHSLTLYLDTYVCTLYERKTKLVSAIKLAKGLRLSTLLLLLLLLFFFLTNYYNSTCSCKCMRDVSKCESYSIHIWDGKTINIPFWDGPFYEDILHSYIFMLSCLLSNEREVCWLDSQAFFKLSHFATCASIYRR